MKFQFPTLTGNLIVMAFSSGVYYPTSLSDSKNNTYTNTGVVLTTDACIKITPLAPLAIQHSWLPPT
jgi:hypothetical protein